MLNLLDIDLLIILCCKLVLIFHVQQVSHTNDGLEAIVFTAQGDMRQALNNLQSTFNGFGHVNSENVFKVCDEPHPVLIKDMLNQCVEGQILKAYKVGFFSLLITRFVHSKIAYLSALMGCIL